MWKTLYMYSFIAQYYTLEFSMILLKFHLSLLINELLETFCKFKSIKNKI